MAKICDAGIVFLGVGVCLLVEVVVVAPFAEQESVVIWFLGGRDASSTWSVWLYVAHYIAALLGGIFFGVLVALLQKV